MEFLFIPVGAMVGTLSGFFGIGGGIIVVPVLLLAGFSSAFTAATSLMFVLGTSLSGAFAHARMKNVVWKYALVIGGAGIISTQLSNRIQLFITGRYDWLLTLWYIMLLCYFAWVLFREKNREQEKKMSRYPYLAAAFIGVVAGFFSALIGIGGGFIIPPLLISWAGFETKKAIGTTLASVIFISLGGSIGYALRIDLNYLLGLCLIVGAFIGAPFGARMTKKYENAEIKQRLGKLYIVAITAMALDLLAIFTVPYFKWLSLALLVSFMFYMLFDFYRRLKPMSQ